jgi:hypothetical protein
MLKILKLVLMIWVALTAPITLFAFGWGLKALFLNAPIWVSVVIYASVITTGLSFAYLIDEQRS